MKRKIHRYEGEDITVEYDVARCIHAAECVHGLPAVFDTDRRPWVHPDDAPADEVAETVRSCPTGALRYRREDGGPAESSPNRNRARVAPDGPLYLTGRFVLHLPGGETLEEARMALCRCGASKNKPFCDDSHREAGFADAGEEVEARLRPAEDAEGAAGEESAVELRLAADGPILVSGPLEIVGADGSSAEGVKGALCRCGSSEAKPFCDGAHRDAGFEAG